MNSQRAEVHYQNIFFFVHTHIRVLGARLLGARLRGSSAPGGARLLGARPLGTDLAGSPGPGGKGGAQDWRKSFIWVSQMALFPSQDASRASRAVPGAPPPPPPKNDGNLREMYEPRPQIFDSVAINLKRPHKSDVNNDT